MRRRYVIALAVVGLAIFIVISALLARAFSVGGAEDGAISDLVTAEADGDTAGVVTLIAGCAASAACRAHAARLTTSLRRPGAVSVIQITPSAGFSLTGTIGTARVAWLVGSSLPRVQCIRVRHAGDLLRGFRVDLLGVSARIPSGADCPPRF